MIDGRISFIGFGISNRAMYKLLNGYGYEFTVRSRNEVRVPDGVKCIFGEDYLCADEEMIFRSPSCMPWQIKGDGKILSEASVALSLLSCGKIGVTGSDGKTTVATLIQKMMAKEKGDAYLGGNNGYPLVNYVGRLKKNDCLVCELSSFQLVDMCTQLDTAVITGITENHLDVHSSMEEYAMAKANVLKCCDRAVLNLDNPYFEYFLKRVPKDARTVCATMHSSKAFTVNNASFVYPKDGYIYYDTEALFPVDCIRLRGGFNTLNVCLAAGAVYPTVSGKNMGEALREFYGVSSRMELTAVKGGVSFYDSSIDSTPARTAATLSAFPKEKIIVLLGGYDKNLSYGVLRDALSGIKGAIICGANSEKIHRSVEGVCNTYLRPGLVESIKTAYRIASEGDIVILSPASASFDAFENYKKRSEKFKETVRGL